MTVIQARPQLTAQQTIEQLAKQHGITHHHTPIDTWGNHISQLSDSEVELDEIQWLLIELGRARILTGKDNTMLHAQYLQERIAWTHSETSNNGAIYATFRVSKIFPK
jgi:hypothetical protein